MKKEHSAGEKARIFVGALFVLVVTIALFWFFLNYAGLSLLPSFSGYAVAGDSGELTFSQAAGLLFFVVLVAAFLVAFFMVARREGITM